MQSSCNWLQTFNMFCSIKSVVVTVVSRVPYFFLIFAENPGAAMTFFNESFSKLSDFPLALS